MKPTKTIRPGEHVIYTPDPSRRGEVISLHYTCDCPYAMVRMDDKPEPVCVKITQPDAGERAESGALMPLCIYRLRVRQIHASMSDMKAHDLQTITQAMLPPQQQHRWQYKAADIWNCSLRTVERYCHDDCIPADRERYLMEYYEQFMKSNRKHKTSGGKEPSREQGRQG